MTVATQNSAHSISPPGWLKGSPIPPLQAIDPRDAVVARIRALGELKPNWDSYGARAIDPARINAAIAFAASRLSRSAPPPAVVPTSLGGIQLEWHRAAADLEIEFVAADCLRVYCFDQRNGRESELTLAHDWASLTPFLDRISEDA